MEENSVFISLKDISKIDWESPELKKEYEEIEERNKALLESTKPDYNNMNQVFDF